MLRFAFLQYFLKNVEWTFKEDVISCGARLYKVKFIPDHPNIAHYGSDEYKYISVHSLIGSDEKICQLRPTNYRTDNHTIQMIKLVIPLKFSMTV
jgi:hypothetical protein